MSKLSVGLVEHFIEQLAVAVYDAQLEADGNRLLFYVDADVAVRMVAGYEEMRGSQIERLVRSLMACGFCGRLSLLRAHATELYDWISWHAGEKRGFRRSFEERVREYLEDANLVGAFDSLATVAVGGEGEELGNAERFLTVLRERSVQAFVGLENAMGPWESRLRRLYGPVLSGGEMGPEMRQLLSETGGVVGEAMSALRSLQGATPFRSPSSDYRDASALGALYWLRRQPELVGGGTYVRFYTETSVVREALNTPMEFASRLEYDADLLDIGYAVPNCRRIVRSPEYFVMRCRFPELRFGQVGSTSALADMLSAARRRRILSLEGVALERALEEITLRGEKLARIVEEFGDLSLIKSIWTDGLIPPPVLKALPEWTPVIQVLTGAKTAAILDRRIEHIEESLREGVGQLRTWMRDFELLISLTQDTPRAGFVALAQMNDLAVEARLGMRRWGIMLDQRTQIRIVRTLTQLDASSLGLFRICEDVASSMERSPEHRDDLIYAATIMWALGGYPRLARMLERYSEAKDVAEIPFRLLHAAALLREGLGVDNIDASWVSGWDARVRDLEGLIEATGERGPGELKIGLGYNLFHLSRRVEGWAQRSTTGRGPLNRWLVGAIIQGEEARKRLVERTLPWALAVNHCLYIGVMGGGETGKILENQEALRSCEGGPLWNARFDDTIACYYMWRFRKRVAGTSRDGLEEDLKMARRYLAAATAGDIGDIAVPEHQAQLERLEGELLVL